LKSCFYVIGVKYACKALKFHAPHLVALLLLRVARVKFEALAAFRAGDAPVISASLAALTANSRLYLQRQGVILSTNHKRHVWMNILERCD